MAKGNASEFDKTHSVSTAESKGGGGKSRGVENPIPEDMALIGDTRHPNHTQSLPRLVGPNFGYGGVAPSDQFRVECGKGASGEC